MSAVSSPVPDDVFLIFIGHSVDAARYAKAVVSLERDLQGHLDALRKVDGTIGFRTVKCWEWRNDAPSDTGGQLIVIAPVLQRANAAVFPIVSRIGPVTRQEIDEVRTHRPRVPVIVFFPHAEPEASRNGDPVAQQNWHEIRALEQRLTQDWTAEDSNSVRPVEHFRSQAMVKNVAVRQLKSAITEACRRTKSLLGKRSAVIDGKRWRLWGGGRMPLRKLMGRTKDHETVKSLLVNASQGPTPGIVVVHGIPGVGKTTLMRSLAADPSLADWFPDGGFWTSVGDSPVLPGLLRDWGHWLKLPVVEQFDEMRLAEKLQERFNGRRIVLFVDDVWQASHAESFRLCGAGSVVVYTTRLPGLANQLAISPDAVHTLAGLEHSDALQLLASVAPDAVRNHPAECDQLVDDVEGVPLAVLAAGKLLHREAATGGDVAKILAEIRDNAKLLLSQPVPQDMANLLTQTTPKVVAVLQRSTQALHPVLLKHFASLGRFPAKPNHFALEYVAGFWHLSEPDAKKILKELIDRGLLESAGRGKYSIHPLMRALALWEWLQRDYDWAS